MCDSKISSSSNSSSSSSSNSSSSSRSINVAELLSLTRRQNTNMFTGMVGMFHPTCDAGTAELWYAHGGNVVPFSTTSGPTFQGSKIIRFVPAWIGSYLKVAADAPIDDILAFAEANTAEFGPGLLDSWITVSHSFRKLQLHTRYLAPIHKIRQQKRAREEFAENGSTDGGRPDVSKRRKSSTDITGEDLKSSIDMAALMYSGKEKRTVPRRKRMQSPTYNTFVWTHRPTLMVKGPLNPMAKNHLRKRNCRFATALNWIPPQVKKAFTMRI